MGMGRARKSNKHLPRRLYLRHGAYYFSHADGHLEHLGRDYSAALRLWAERTGEQESTTIRTMDDAFDRYLIEVVPLKSPRSQQNNRQQFKPLRKVFSHMRPADLKAVHGYAYLDARRKTPVAANLEMALFKHVCTCLVRWGVIERNPMREVRKLHVNPRDRDVLDWEFDAVYARAGERMRCAMDLARLTGLREGDILSLRRDSLTPDGLLVPTRKTGKRLIFAMTDALMAAIERLKALHGTVASIPLFTGRRGQALTSAGFQSEWKRLQRRALDSGALTEGYHFNDLRALAAAESEDPTKLLGHDNPATTKIYLRRPTKVTPTR